MKPTRSSLLHHRRQSAVPPKPVTDALKETFAFIRAHSSIRFSIGRFTTEAEIDAALARVKATVERLRELSPLWDMHCAGVDISAVQWAEH